MKLYSVSITFYKAKIVRKSYYETFMFGFLIMYVHFTCIANKSWITKMNYYVGCNTLRLTVEK